MLKLYKSLNPDSLVGWKRSSGSYNFDCYPRSVIISPVGNLGFLDRFKYKPLKGVLGQHYKLSSNLALCHSGFGGAAIDALVKELVVLGVKRLVFVGIGGRIGAGIEEGEVCLVKTAKIEEEKACFGKNTFDPLHANSFTSVKVLSRFSPFYDDAIVFDGYDMVDMETAYFYKVCSLYKVDCCAYLVGADNITNQVWSVSNDVGYVSKKVKNTISSLQEILK